jgi:hypothetical protein
MWKPQIDGLTQMETTRVTYLELDPIRARLRRIVKVIEAKALPEFFRSED